MNIIEVILLTVSSLVFIFSLLFIPGSKRYQAQFVFLFIQFPTWLLGLVAVETRLLEYPVHELAESNSTSFIFEYLILPIYCIHFNARFPEHASRKLKLLVYCGASMLLTGAEIVIERYTAIIEYTGWTWATTFLSVLFILWLSRAVTLWFFRIDRPGQIDD